MQMTGNTILVTGGGTGLGRGLAEAFHKRGNTVIIAGRRKSVLDDVTAANPGMSGLVLDIADPQSIALFADRIVTEHPALDTVIHMAGIMQNENLKKGSTLATAEATIATNLLGPIRLNDALLPHLLSRPKATIMTVTSGLAYLPLAMTPTYSATKAAIHAWTLALRYQLQDTGIDVLELVPPYVRTGLMGERQANDPHAMPLEAFTAEVMGILEAQPDVQEILVEAVKPLRFAERSGQFDEAFKARNDMLMKVRGAEF
ncbi:SDR family oxidoreductase [Mangrovibrevibacter kandeliae]|uniref:SDR family oxidoreductase n=1 Tax=Mangrovibrevibacter kandeliae TaxID=2968473 RepID=UPI0021190670|nr:SDR family oxidoreductase [Aurantimonas sp. CSK15Z-1]MCQ8784205.1 SDR family oxidoreductase [Aurantimonas sp. CSK15Z-1]